MVQYFRFGFLATVDCTSNPLRRSRLLHLVHLGGPRWLRECVIPDLYRFGTARKGFQSNRPIAALQRGCVLRRDAKRGDGAADQGRAGVGGIDGGKEAGRVRPFLGRWSRWTERMKDGPSGGGWMYNRHENGSSG